MRFLQNLTLKGCRRFSSDIVSANASAGHFLSEPNEMQKKGASNTWNAF